MLKIIDYGFVWTCENMDNLAPIDWDGYKVLFSDGSIKVIDDLDFDLYIQTNNKADDIYPDDKNVYIATDKNEEEISVDLAYFDKGE